MKHFPVQRAYAFINWPHKSQTDLPIGALEIPSEVTAAAHGLCVTQRRGKWGSASSVSSERDEGMVEAYLLPSHYKGRKLNL